MAGLSKMWVTGTAKDGTTAYFNVNAILGLKLFNENDFVVFLGGHETVFLKDCTFADEYPPFIDE